MGYKSILIIVLALMQIVLIFYVFNKHLNTYELDRKTITTGIIYTVIAAFVVDFLTITVAGLMTFIPIEINVVLQTGMLTYILLLFYQYIMQIFCVTKTVPNLEYKKVSAFSLGYGGLTPLLSASLMVVGVVGIVVNPSMVGEGTLLATIPTIDSSILTIVRYVMSAFGLFALRTVILIYLVQAIKKKRKLDIFITALIETGFTLLAFLTNDLLAITIFVVLIFLIIKMAIPKIRNMYDC